MGYVVLDISSNSVQYVYAFAIVVVGHAERLFNSRNFSHEVISGRERGSVALGAEERCEESRSVHCR
jgi:hypothetical protein